MFKNGSDEFFLKQAVDLASENVRQGGGPFGAVIVKAGKVIGEGTNGVTRSLDPTAHAEVSAIRDACKNIQDFSLKGSTLYTSCEPCPMCLSAIYWARIDRIVYGNNRQQAANIGFDDSYIYDQVSLDLSKRDIPMQNLIPEVAIESFKIWDSYTGKTRY